jgi:PAS domain S-box-containing protein
MTYREDKYSRFLKFRITAPVILTVILLITAFFLFFLPALENNLMNKKKEMIRELVNTVWSLLDEYEHLRIKNLLTIDEAKQNALNRILNLRYGPENKDYFWITDYYPNMIMHPFNPELNGQSLKNYTDPNGKKFFVEFVKVVENEGFGFVDYIWQWKDDPDRLVPKLSYVRGYEPWGWIIGTGIYIEDVREEIDKIVSKLTITLLGILIIVSLLLSHQISQGFRIENDRRIAREKLMESELMYRTIFENSGTALMISEPDMTVSLVNSEFENLTGYTKEEFEGNRKWIDLIHEDELDKLVEYHKQRRKNPSGIPKKYETKAYHKSGDIKNFYINVELIPGTDKSIVSVVDITQQKKYEKELIKERNFSTNLIQYSPAFFIATDKKTKNNNGK